MSRPKNKFKRGQLVMLLEDYLAWPKMSLSVLIPSRVPLKVLRTKLASEKSNYTKRNWVIIKGFNNDTYDLPVPEDKLVLYTDIDKYLYGE